VNIAKVAQFHTNIVTENIAFIIRFHCSKVGLKVVSDNVCIASSDPPRQADGIGHVYGTIGVYSSLRGPMYGILKATVPVGGDWLGNLGEAVNAALTEILRET